MAKYLVCVSDERHASYEIERSILEKAGAELKLCHCTSAADIAEQCADADAVLLDLAPMPAEAVAGLKKCKVISRYGVGFENVDLDAATAAGIQVTNVPDYCMEDVSDHALALMLSCLLRLRMGDHGTVMVWLPLAISFGSDTFALFVGMACGKHKLAPHVSPKKTIEGGVGGLLGGVIGMILLHAIGTWALGESFLSWGQILALGLLGSVIDQIGDLSFSVIKREFGVKDYGKLLPGHGGVLDRFDSVTFVAPFAYLLAALLG